MEIFTSVDNGNVVPAIAIRKKFASDLRDTIVNQLHRGRDVIYGVMNGKEVTCHLSSAGQLLDFIDMVPSETEGEVEVTYWMHSHDQKVAWQRTFVYKPPHYEEEL